MSHDENNPPDEARDITSAAMKEKKPTLHALYSYAANAISNPIANHRYSQHIGGSTRKGFAGSSDLAADCLDTIILIKGQTDGRVKLLPNKLVEALHSFLDPSYPHWIFEPSSARFCAVEPDYARSLQGLQIPQTYGHEPSKRDALRSGETDHLCIETEHTRLLPLRSGERLVAEGGAESGSEVSRYPEARPLNAWSTVLSRWPWRERREFITQA